MYPTAFFGITSLALAAWYAIAPLPRLLPLVKGLGVASLLAGVLGTTMGIKATVTALVASPDLPPDRSRSSRSRASASRSTTSCSRWC